MREKRLKHHGNAKRQLFMRAGISDHKNSAGFTLIELLVVVAIIGILSSVALVNLNSARREARIAQVQSNLNSMVDAGVLCQSYADGSGTIGELNCPVLGSPTGCNWSGPGSRLVKSGEEVCIGVSGIGIWPTLPDGWAWLRTLTASNSNGLAGTFQFTACEGTSSACTGARVDCDQSGCETTE